MPCVRGAVQVRIDNGAKRAAFLAVEPGTPMDPKLCCKEAIGTPSLLSMEEYSTS